jgi:hypothetical protein
MSKQIDVNELVNGLLDQVAQQAKEIAMLRVHLAIATKDDAEEGVAEDGND